jgi:hypothetical protein
MKKGTGGNVKKSFNVCIFTKHSKKGVTTTDEIWAGNALPDFQTRHTARPANAGTTTICAIITATRFGPSGIFHNSHTALTAHHAHAT